MKTGFGKKCITPPLGYPIVGYYEERLASGVISQLYVRAAAFEEGGVRAALLTVDVVGLSRQTCEQIRRQVARSCAVEQNAVLIGCSHTHTGPLTGADFASDKVANPAYMESLCRACLEATEQAFSQLAQTRIFLARTQAEGISHVRRFLLKDGRVSKPYALGHPDIVSAVGEPDRTVTVIKLLRQNSRDLALVHFGTHCDTVQGDQLCADFPGFLCDTLEGALEATDVMFLLAPQGDVAATDFTKPDGGKVTFRKDPLDPRCAAPQARHLGKALAGAVLTVYDRAQSLRDDTIRFATATLEAPTNKENHRLEEAARVNAQYEAGEFDSYPAHKKTCLAAEARRILRLKDAPDTQTLEVFALRLGQLAVVGLPGEPFTALRRQIEERSPFAHTVVCCLVNDEASYIPYEQAYQEGSYEVLTTKYGPKTAPLLVDTTVALLEKLR